MWLIAKNNKVLEEKMNAIQEVNRAAFESNQTTERIRRTAVERIMRMEVKDDNNK